jgi:hypothetical protein
MTTTDPHLDLPRLEKLRRRGDRFIARCPACAVTGGDRRGDHLVILPNGKFACVAHSGDAEHRREIFVLVGIRGERQPDPERDRRWRKTQVEKRRKIDARKTLTDSVRSGTRQMPGTILRSKSTRRSPMIRGTSFAA